MEIVNEIFNLCIEKGLCFSFNPNVEILHVHTHNHDLHYSSYYSGELIDYSKGNNKTIIELLEILKKYKR